MISTNAALWDLFKLTSKINLMPVEVVMKIDKEQAYVKVNVKSLLFNIQQWVNKRVLALTLTLALT